MTNNNNLRFPGTEESKASQAASIVRSNMLWAIGSGLLPVPFLDMAGVAAVQLKMLNEISYIYGLRFSENKVKKILGALAGSLGTTAVASAPLSSLIKFVPFVGSLSGMLTLPVIAGASTYAVGRVFIVHFESGGTFLDFNADTMRNHFVKEYEEGKNISEHIQESTQEQQVK